MLNKQITSGRRADDNRNAHTSGGRKKISLTTQIMVAMVAGILVGVIFNTIGSDFINTHIVGGLFAMSAKTFTE